jgi:hypothetical protein
MYIYTIPSDRMAAFNSYLVRVDWAFRFDNKKRQGNCFICNLSRKGILIHKGNKKGWRNK